MPANALDYLKQKNADALNCLELNKFDKTDYCERKQIKDPQEIKIKKPKTTCYGVTNRTKSGEYVFFADYDRIEFGRLTKELDDLIARFPFHFTNFAILESSPSLLIDGKCIGSYHVISFAKLPFQKLCNILGYTTVDPLFFKMLSQTEYRSNTLRVSPKFAWEEQFEKETNEGCGLQEFLKEQPRFVCFYPTTEKLSTKFEVSTAHLNTYRALGLIKNPMSYAWGKKEDGSRWIEIKKYESGV